MTKPKTVLICGGREWSDVYAILRELRALPKSVKTVIHGACRGADNLAGDIAEGLGFEVIPVPAHWKHTDDCHKGCGEYCGKGAGQIRNRKMLSMRPDLVLAFHKDIKKSKGTAHMVGIARAAGLDAAVFDK